MSTHVITQDTDLSVLVGKPVRFTRTMPDIGTWTYTGKFIDLIHYEDRHAIGTLETDTERTSIHVPYGSTVELL